MNIWNGKVGDIVTPANNEYRIKSADKIGFEGGEVADYGEVPLYYSTKLVLLDVGLIECVARVTECEKSGPSITDQSYERTYGLVFKIPTSVLIGWCEEDERKERESYRYKMVNAEKEKQNELDRDKWC